MQSKANAPKTDAHVDIERDTERRSIRDAMQRLIDGKPLRSNGKLTIKDLAEEAGIKRWKLTHRHVDLQAEFRARIEKFGILPPPVQELSDKLDAANMKVKGLRIELKNIRAENERYARIINTLVLEKQEMVAIVRDLTERITPTRSETEKN